MEKPRKSWNKLYYTDYAANQQTLGREFHEDDFIYFVAINPKMTI